MSLKRRHQKTNSRQAAAIADPPVAARQGRTAIWVTMLVGLLLGAAIAMLHLRLVGKTVAVERDNSLLVSQQLDELFRKIEEQVAADPAQLPTFAELLQVYYTFDHRFVEQNEGNPQTTCESTCAAHRVAQCALIFRDYKKSSTYYRTVRNLLLSSISTTPETHSLVLRELVDAQSRIAVCERLAGNTGACIAELRDACELIDSAPLPESSETVEWLEPVMSELVNVCFDLGLDEERSKLSARFEAVATAAAQVSADEVERSRLLEQAARFRTFAHSPAPAGKG